MYEILTKLENLILEFEKEFSFRKREKNIVDFNDIEHFALQILLKEDHKGNIIQTEVAKRYQEKFEEIAIDEYQDSNLVQEYILNSVSKNNNIFMVGDVKQSIYKFRQARPELFLEKYENYSLDKSSKLGRKIKLFKNFRSRKNVLDFTNLIFENIMSKEVGDILYNNEEYLNLGAKYENIDDKILDDVNGKTEINIIDLKEEIDEFDNTKEQEQDEGKEEDYIIENNMVEAKFVANKIKEIIKSEVLVFDKKKGYRKVTYKDIVILLRATSNLSPIYEKEISSLGIPVFSESTSEFLESIEIQTILAVLKIIDNPMQDIPLVCVLRSPIFGFTDDELVKIRLIDKECNFYEAFVKARINYTDELKNKIDNTLECIKKWQNLINEKPLDELIWKIYMDSNYYNYVGLMSNGSLRQANLKMLFERAKQYEKASFKGLFNFINFIDKLKSTSGDMTSAKLIGENEDVVRIMSIHKSKGLEFPIVILSGTGKGFNLMDLNDVILMHQDIGFGPKMINYENRIEYNTLAKEAIRLNSYSETISEEMRILYVALTRAKEKLIITGISKDAEKELKEKEELLNLYKFNNNDRLDDILNFEVIKKDDILKIESNKDEINELGQKNLINKLIKKSQDLYDKNSDVIKQINWQYKFINSAKIPTKTSVTKIKELENENLLNLDELNNEKMDSYKKILEITPKFLNEEEKVTSAKKGTLMHLCVQKINEKNIYDYSKIKNMIEDLYNKEIITKSEKDAININKLFKYTQSDLFKELAKAKEIFKEQPFYININSGDIFRNDTNESILVQGIIDLYYINSNDELILVDYKTDFVEDGKELSFFSKYNKQLEIYKKALEQSMQRKVDKTYIYSLYLNKLIEIEI